MQRLDEQPISTLDDVTRFEEAMPLESRLPGDSVFDVFVATAQRSPKAAALTMVGGKNHNGGIQFAGHLDSLQ